IDKNENNSNRKRKKPLKSIYYAKHQKKADLTRSLKVRVYSNFSQKTLLKQWMGKNVENCDDIQITKNLNIVAIDPGIHT
ncbi:14374_t:CDS:2, partial [Funneliformis mosseae]